MNTISFNNFKIIDQNENDQFDAGDEILDVEGHNLSPDSVVIKKFLKEIGTSDIAAFSLSKVSIYFNAMKDAEFLASRKSAYLTAYRYSIVSAAAGVYTLILPQIVKDVEDKIDLAREAANQGGFYFDEQKAKTILKRAQVNACEIELLAAKSMADQGEIEAVERTLEAADVIAKQYGISIKKEAVWIHDHAVKRGMEVLFAVAERCLQVVYSCLDNVEGVLNKIEEISQKYQVSFDRERANHLFISACIVDRDYYWSEAKQYAKNGFLKSTQQMLERSRAAAFKCGITFDEKEASYIENEARQNFRSKSLSMRNMILYYES